MRTWTSPGRATLRVLVCLVTGFAGALAMPAGQALAATDVILVFDTTGSMDDAISDAQEQVRGVMDRLSERVPDVQFALGEVKDYPFDPYGDAGDQPWRVVQPMTADRAAMQSAVDGLTAEGGGNGPEAYGRAMYEAEEGGGGVGWRPGARRVAVVVADNMPHDDDLNAGVPPEIHSEPSPYDTGADPGRDGALGTGDDLDWQGVLDKLNERGLPMMLVLYQGTEERLRYWNHWASLTGGEAVMGGGEDSSVLADKLVTLAERGARSSLRPCPKPGFERGGDGICREQPVVFIPGIMGSEIWCGDRRLWFEYRVGRGGIDHKGLMLAADGRSPNNPADACNRSAGPREGQILTKVAVRDVYAGTIAMFQQRFAERFWSFAYDWRKAPADSVGALDAFIDKVRAAHGGIRVRVVAHSMGGLLTRAYIDDPARAGKVSHAVTLGTPYWGSPKTVLPYAKGETDPGLGPALDAALDNGEVKEMSANFAGLYSLLPSEAWHRHVGDWLTIEEESRRAVTGATNTAAAMWRQWRNTNTGLYVRATAAHRSTDGFKTNGVRLLAIVGSGHLTVGALNYDRNLLGDDYEFSYTNGDSTVPLYSAAQGAPGSPPLGEPVPRRYRCGVKHDALTGDKDDWAAAVDFLTNGTTGLLAGEPCRAEGDEIVLRAVPTGKARSSAGTGELSVRISQPGGAPLKPSDAERAGLLQVVESDPAKMVLVVPRGQVLGLSTRGRQLTITTRALTDSAAAKPRVYGPTNSTLAIATGPGTTVARKGRILRSRPADRRAPTTRLRVLRRGKGAVLRFTARDNRRVRATVVKVGRRKAARLTGRTIRIRRLTRRGVLVKFESVDVFGNHEHAKQRRIRARR